VHTHLSGKDESGIINLDHLLDLVDDCKLYLSQSQNDKGIDLQKHTRTGWPLGGFNFIQIAESMLSRVLTKAKPGPKIKNRIIKCCVPFIQRVETRSVKLPANVS
jgi:hypothetical protein